MKHDSENPNLMSNNNIIAEEAENTLELVSLIQSDLSKQSENVSPELQKILLKLQELTARLESHLAVKH